MSNNELLYTKADEKKYAEIRSEIAEKEAKERGCVVVKPRADQLFIDIDNDAGLEVFLKTIEIVRRVHALSWKQTKSVSGEPGHWHIVVTFLAYEVEELERIALQAFLGSDPQREALSYIRLKCGDPTLTLFFEKPEGTA